MATVIRGGEVPYHEAPEPALRRFGKFLVTRGSVADPPVTLGRFLYPPGARSHSHVHPFSTEIYYCLAGELEACVGDERHRLGPGDLIVIPPGSRHHAANGGDTPMEFMAVHSPPVSDYEEFRTTWIQRPAQDPGGLAGR